MPRHFALELRVPDGKHLIDDQNLRFQVGRHGERQPHVHAAGIMLHRRVEELFHFREGDDLIEFPGDFRPSHSEDGAVQEHILAAGQFGMEARADFQQAADPAVNLDFARRRLRDLGQHLQQGTLAGPVAADDADHFSTLNVE